VQYWKVLRYCCVTEGLTVINGGCCGIGSVPCISQCTCYNNMAHSCDGEQLSVDRRQKFS
jgi:hypothetical protein